MKQLIQVPNSGITAAYKDNASRPMDMQHSHEACEIMFFVSVNAVFFIKDTRYEVHEGDVIFINEYDIHKLIYQDAAVSYQRYLIHFKKNDILPTLKAAHSDQLLDSLKHAPCPLASTTIKERMELESLFHAMVSAKNPCNDSLQPSLKEAAQKSYLTLLLIRIWQLIHGQEPSRFPQKKDQLVQEIIQFIDGNYGNSIRLDILENWFHMDRFHICRVFRQVTGFSVMEYVQHRRIIEAQKMLKKTPIPIIQICFDCGFHNIQHFYRVFRKITGMTPDRYRKQYRSG